MARRLSIVLVALLALSLLPGCSAQRGPVSTPPPAVVLSPTPYVTPTLPPTWTPRPPTPTNTRVIQPTSTLTPGPSPTPTRLPARTTALVLAVQDSRTLEVLIDGQPIERGFTVRLLGVESPRLSDPWAGVAVEWLVKETSMKVVVLESDERERDAQGNLLRYVWKEGRMVNVTMVQLGLATTSEDAAGLSYDADLVDAQADARAAGRGLWGPPPTPTPTPVITTATLTATQTSTVTLTVTQTPTATLTVTQTSAAPPTATQTLTATLSPASPP